MEQNENQEVELDMNHLMKVRKEKLDNLKSCLIKNDFKENEIEKIFHKNIMRVLKKVLK